jgi:hypothetical protein
MQGGQIVPKTKIKPLTFRTNPKDLFRGVVVLTPEDELMHRGMQCTFQEGPSFVIPSEKGYSKSEAYLWTLHFSLAR